MSEPEQVKIQRNFLKTDAISKHLYCTICQEVYYFPRRIKCGHTYCNHCINCWKKKNSTCPICRTSFTESTISKDLIAFNLINDLEVTCNNEGCVWKGILSEQEQHLKYCSMDPEKPKFLKKMLDFAEIDSNFSLFDAKDEQKNYLNSNRILANQSNINLNPVQKPRVNYWSKLNPDVLKNSFAPNNLNNISNNDHINSIVRTLVKIDSENSGERNGNDSFLLNHLLKKNINNPFDKISANSVIGENSKNTYEGLEAVEEKEINSKKNELKCDCPNCINRLQRERNLRFMENISVSSNKNLQEDKMLEIALKLSEQTYKEDDTKRSIAVEEARKLQEKNSKIQKDKPARKKRSLPPANADSTYAPKGKKIKKK